MTEKDTAAIPVAWMTEDGRVATASAKPNMPSAAKEAFNIALFPHPQGQPARVDVDRIIAIFREHTRAEVGVKDESEWKEPEWVKFENGLRARLEALNEQP